MQHSAQVNSICLQNISQADIFETNLKESMFFEPDGELFTQSLTNQFECITQKQSGKEVCLKQFSIPTKGKKKENVKKIPKRKSPKRHDNTIASNTVRLLKLCIKQIFQKDLFIYQQFTHFFTLHSIRGQIWAFDAILIFILYMRDQTGQINKDYFENLESLVFDRLVMIEYRSKNLLQKQRIARYRAHCQLYFNEKRNFSKVGHLNDEIQGFFASLISKRKLVITQCMRSIEKITESIKNKQIAKEISTIVKITPRTRAKSRSQK